MKTLQQNKLYYYLQNYYLLLFNIFLKDVIYFINRAYLSNYADDNQFFLVITILRW